MSRDKLLDISVSLASCWPGSGTECCLCRRSANTAPVGYSASAEVSDTGGSSWEKGREILGRKGITGSFRLEKTSELTGSSHEIVGPSSPREAGNPSQRAELREGCHRTRRCLQQGSGGNQRRRRKPGKEVRKTNSRDGARGS